MTGSKRWTWEKPVPELGVGLGVCGGRVVVVGKVVPGSVVDGPSRRES